MHKGIICQGKLNFSYNQGGSVYSFKYGGYLQGRVYHGERLIYVDGHVFCEGGIIQMESTHWGMSSVTEMST